MCPEPVRYIWEWFCELARGRTMGPAGPNPITWEAIAAWAGLCRLHLDPLEVRLIMRIDAVFLEVMRANREVGNG